MHPPERGQEEGVGEEEEVVVEALAFTLCMEWREVQSFNGNVTGV